jgi:hypothetical protein
LLEIVLNLSEACVDEVLDVVVHGSKRKTGNRSIPDHAEDRAVVDDVASGHNI